MLTSGFRVKSAGCPAFREAAVRKIFQMIQNKFLARDLLEFLDSLANDIYVTNSVKVFPYKSFSETLTLVLISLLRELVHAQPLLAGILINDIQGYIKQIFQSGSEKLSTKNQDITEKETDKSGLNVAKLSLLTNAVCVDILVWAAREEAGQYSVITAHRQSGALQWSQIRLVHSHWSGLCLLLAGSLWHEG